MNKRIVAILFCYFGTTLGCDWLENVNVSGVDTNDNKFTQVLSGCISDASFNFSVKILYIRNQEHIETLGEGSVRNMSTVRTVSFWGCPIETITPGLFLDVPNLVNVQIAYGNLQEIPRGAFSNLPAMEMLRIHNNKIDIIEDLSFANLRFLKRIHVDFNQLEYWNREWFTNSTNVEILDFQVNKIRTLPRRAFEKLPKLRQIYFDDNDISVIHADAFKGIRKLEYLGLRYNQLKEINENIFPNNLKIRTLLLDRNNLNFLANEVLKKISAEDVTLDNNPWKCPCLDRIKYWVFVNNGTIRETQSCIGGRIPVCAYSTGFSQTCLEYVDNELTERYRKALLSVVPPIDKTCLQ
ncbi:hypothetical protein GWI33_010498 [Rhynchophorus ferrugineus]|uniref:Uncharacterized protein n=1 Tax=Rhynchophorus ferrugineus TaxID=354439 RepID=A0A834IS96_RHYFE|nr:hypothetical protein GWI33_010498 [Rhynchophorus ferrugineus]